MRNIRTARRGFTLIEILIVVVILGILAAIVIPQFTNASDEAQESHEGLLTATGVPQGRRDYPPRVTAPEGAE